MGALSNGMLAFAAATMVALMVSCVVSYMYGRKLQAKPTTRGINGVSGDVLTMQCPSGQTISLTSNQPGVPRIFLACAGGGTSNPVQCDAFFQAQGQGNSTYNLGAIAPFSTAQIEGQNSFTFTVPTPATVTTASGPWSSSSITGCVAGCTSPIGLSLIGTYDCV